MVDATTSGAAAGSERAVATGEPGSTRAQGAIANDDGRFVIADVDAGDVTLRARLLGYKPLERVVAVVAGDTARVELRLEPEAAVLGAVKTEARPIERDAFDTRPSVGTVQITSRAAEGVPKFGEPDIIRVVQLLPGVEARNDFSTGLNVRGGEADQNLIQIDGYPIYNPFHLGGLFSTFIDPTVSDVQLLTGGFPARYGGRLSSVLDVRSADETRSGIHGDADLSVIASTLELGSAFDQGKGSWMIAGRRTYADEFVKLISTNQLPYHFRDEQGHVSFAFSPSTQAHGNGVQRPRHTQRGHRDVRRLGERGRERRELRLQLGKQRRRRHPDVELRSTRPVAVDALCFSATARRSSSGRRYPVLDAAGSRRGVARPGQRCERSPTRGDVTGHTVTHDRSFGYEVASYGITYNANSSQAGTTLYNLRQIADLRRALRGRLWRVNTSFMLEMRPARRDADGHGVGRDLAAGVGEVLPHARLRSHRRRRQVRAMDALAGRARTFQSAYSTSGWRATRRRPCRRRGTTSRGRSGGSG